MKVEFVSDIFTFTKEELTVFAAWEKNAKESAVHK
jgi:hypothetical protein